MNHTSKDFIGAAITAYGCTYEVSKLLYAEYWDRFGYDVEFIDPKGEYHHWKQWDDGGTIKFKKKLIDCTYGLDCTDIFRKYGYNV